ncbi:hypothetical protein amad1_08445 [Alteromonas mediterranea DE1]|uniref:Uncharacterized protein n=1 Tax=Alteromonas mediterranea 615 TaxID=1300253 RepID=S5AEH8_9ALTE|nr:hypothetical protein amad1_08445 [Alteromonas mediterranea DE1]AGP77774.1 hypothetical protein I633_08645 [Alteromonas mediterranea 615]AGP81581.1 hypothetical protein I533_08025 [Alteromonas mediterranea MED64]AGP85341.1 hypothetical protein I607_07715 [Alteromonas mediterranea U4]AGP89463.1 hypothetical protein I876_07975 [Alteromonas mediterranea U7]AGP93335.1 hypothetical protein I634_08085 [Alteromonas mediterranea U8]AGP97211.1 hypothetical protein I635_08435 [Alteromonas mediterrane
MGTNQPIIQIGAPTLKRRAVKVVFAEIKRSASLLKDKPAMS